MRAERFALGAPKIPQTKFSKSYLRNPAGSNHAPFSELGCTILVKLQQMHQADQLRVAINTTNSAWLPGLVSGLEVLPLHGFGSEHVALVRWAPGTVFQPHSHPSGEEIFVLDGVFQDEQGTYPAGSWLRNPPGSIHRPGVRPVAPFGSKQAICQPRKALMAQTREARAPS